MKPSLAPLLLALAAPPLAAQDAPRGPTLLRVAASSSGTVLSLDSAVTARTADSTFVVSAVYHFAPDTARHGVDGQREMQAMDCGGSRIRGPSTSYYSGEMQVPADDTAEPGEWRPVGDDEAPIFGAICEHLLGSFAARLPLTVEAFALALGDSPEIVNRGEMAQLLARGYPRALRDAGVGGTVMVRARITAEGRMDPSTLRVLWASRPAFSTAAVGVVQQMRWRPGRVDGHPADVWVTLPVSFWIQE